MRWTLAAVIGCGGEEADSGAARTAAPAYVTRRADMTCPDELSSMVYQFPEELLFPRLMRCQPIAAGYEEFESSCTEIPATFLDSFRAVYIDCSLKGEVEGSAVELWWLEPAG